MRPPEPNGTVIVALVLSTALAGCFAAPGPQPGSPFAVPMEPTHPPATPEAWARSDAAATEAARARGATDLAAPARVSAVGPRAEHVFSVEKGRCYAVGVGWSFPAKAMISVALEPAEPGGPPPNASFRRVGEPSVAGPSFVQEICVDAPGKATVGLSALTPAGFLAPKERLEFAVVVGSRTEAGAEAEARRVREAGVARGIQADQAANVAAAKAREDRARLERCRECDDAYRLCQVERAGGRGAPRGSASRTRIGLTCEGAFQRCSRDLAAMTGMGDPVAGACGSPPR